MKLYKNINGVNIELTQEEIDNFNANQKEISIEKLKAEKIKQLKDNCSNYIYSVYPIFKQIDIIGQVNATEQDLTNMKIFIENQILICDNKETIINGCVAKEEINNIPLNFGE